MLAKNKEDEPQGMCTLVDPKYSVLSKATIRIKILHAHEQHHRHRHRRGGCEVVAAPVSLKGAMPSFHILALVFGPPNGIIWVQRRRGLTGDMSKYFVHHKDIAGKFCLLTAGNLFM